MCTLDGEVTCPLQILRPIVLAVIARYGARRILCLEHHRTDPPCALVQDISNAKGTPPRQGSADPRSRPTALGLGDKQPGDVLVGTLPKQEEALTPHMQAVARGLQVHDLLVLAAPCTRGLGGLYAKWRTAAHGPAGRWRALLEAEGLAILEQIGVAQGFERQRAIVLVARKRPPPASLAHP
jgi:hypothetical protein